MIERPSADEHAPYYSRYIDLVPAGDLLAILRGQLAETIALVSANAARAGHSYAPGKWTVKEVMGHVCDSERVFAYRALRFARGDSTELPGYDQDAFVANGNFGARPLENVMEEFRTVREATIALAANLNAAELERRGRANGKDVSVRAIFCLTAGHERHHVNVLRERYGLMSTG